MQANFLHKMQCPYTGSDLVVRSIIAGSEDDIEFGIVSSAAGDFPILDGILRLQQDEVREAAVALLERGRYRQAVELVLDWPCRTRTNAAVDLAHRMLLKSGAHSIAAGVTRFKRRLHQQLAQPHGSFCELLDALPVPRYWSEWQKYRFSMSTFLSVYPLVALIKEKRPVLDFACGLGHASYLIARSVGEENTVCADYSFSSLHIARRYFVPRGIFVCLDGNGLLPFKSAQFAGVLCSDAFHFITQKLSLAREFRRLVGDDGVVLLGHLHNKFSPLHSGMPLTPVGYAALFTGVDTRVVPERALIDGYFQDDGVDLAKRWGDEALNASIDGISLVASANTEFFRAHQGSFASALDRVRNPILNPIYQAIRNDTEIVLRKQVSASYRERIEARTGTRVLPDYRLDPACMTGTGREALRCNDPAYLRNLLRDLIALDAPRHYVGERA